MSINLPKLLLLCCLAMTGTTFASEQSNEMLVLQCRDTRTLVHTSKGPESRPNAYRIEVGLILEPKPTVEFFHWGYYPHTETDWGQSSNSHKINLQYLPGLFVVKKADNDVIEVERVARSDEDNFLVQTFVVNRKNGEYVLSSTIQDENRRFITYAGEESSSNNKGFCEAEKRSPNLF